jgi:acylphosphatase
LAVRCAARLDGSLRFGDMTEARASSRKAYRSSGRLGAPQDCAERRGKTRGVRVSVTISGFVSDAKQASRFFVSGSVQGVGFRFFTESEARRLGIRGYVRNLNDGRVEAYAIGTPEQLAKFRAALQRGSRFSTVRDVYQEAATVEPRYAHDFVTTEED